MRFDFETTRQTRESFVGLSYPWGYDGSRRHPGGKHTHKRLEQLKSHVRRRDGFLGGSHA